MLRVETEIHLVSMNPNHGSMTLQHGIEPERKAGYMESRPSAREPNQVEVTMGRQPGYGRLRAPLRVASRR